MSFQSRPNNQALIAREKSHPILSGKESIFKTDNF
jgi:hypothetical protein